MATGPQTVASRKIGVVTGLASEAAVVSAMLDADDASLSVVCAGASSSRAADLARGLIDAGAEALLSFGIAGALDPEFDCGELVVADTVFVDEKEVADVWSCDAAWLERLRDALSEAHLPYRHGMLVGSRRLWREARDKEAIRELTSAVAVDMESGAVAAVAGEAGLPFLVVRAVADRAKDSLPSLVENAVMPDGRSAVGRAIAHLARHPAEIPATFRLARQSELAIAKLRMLAPMKQVLFGGF